ncbi:hypothetical protein GCM10027614_02610 [Micromonospora vulcania]
MDTGEDDFRSELIDLAELDLAELDVLPSTVLIAALQRLDRRSAAPATSTPALKAPSMATTDPTGTAARAGGPNARAGESYEHQQG